jgi:hypothetical protein
LSQKYCLSPHLYAKHTHDPVKLCKEAARREVTLHAFEFKKKAFSTNHTLTCPLDNTPITFYETHVDHVYEFRHILQEFLEQEDLDYESIQTKRTDVPKSVGVIFADRALAKRWYDFHDARTVYRVTSVHGNLVTARKATE